MDEGYFFQSCNLFFFIHPMNKHIELLLIPLNSTFTTATCATIENIAFNSFANLHRSPPIVENWNERKYQADLYNSQDKAMPSVPEREQPPSDRSELVHSLAKPADHIPDTVRRAETAI